MNNIHPDIPFSNHSSNGVKKKATCILQIQIKFYQGQFVLNNLSLLCLDQWAGARNSMDGRQNKQVVQQHKDTKDVSPSIRSTVHPQSNNHFDHNCVSIFPLRPSIILLLMHPYVLYHFMLAVWGLLSSCSFTFPITWVINSFAYKIYCLSNRS